MGRVFFVRNIMGSQLEEYEALGWECVGGKEFALDGVSLMVAWEREGDPIEPSWNDKLEQPAPLAVTGPWWTTRDVVRWNFAPWDLICVIGLALAGLAWGFVDKIRGNK